MDGRPWNLVSKRLLLVLCCAVDMVTALSAAGIRATWLPTSVPIVAPHDMRDLLHQLADTGINRIYLDVWNNGVAYFNSSVVRRLAGQSALSADRLRMAVDTAASMHDFEIVAWMEYGFMACYGPVHGNAFAEVASSRGWIIGSSGGWSWLDPQAASPLLASMIQEITAQYGVATQLDDHFACPSEFAACSAPKMDEAALVVSASSDKLSLSPAPLPFSKNRLSVDWVGWSKKELFNEYVPQLYTSQSDAFAADLLHVVDQLTQHSHLIAGVRVDGSGAPTPWVNVSQMLDTASAASVGVAIWYSDGITRLFPAQFRTKWSHTLS